MSDFPHPFPQHTPVVFNPPAALRQFGQLNHLGLTGPFLPICTPPDAFGDTITLHTVVMGVIRFSPAFVSAMLLSLGTMVVSPFALSLIPILGSNRLLGTSFGFYCLVQGSGAVVGNLAIVAAFDVGTTLGFQSFPWLLLLGFGLASAARMISLDRKGMKAHTSGLSCFVDLTEVRSEASAVGRM